MSFVIVHMIAHKAHVPCFLLRTILKPDFSQPDVQILHPINMNLSVDRNLAGSWYHKIPLLEIKGHLDTMNVSSFLFGRHGLVSVMGQTSLDNASCKSHGRET